MDKREDIIRELRRQDIIKQLRTRETPTAPEKSGAEQFADVTTSMRANMEDFAPLQGVRDRLGAGASAIIGQTKDTFGDDSGKSLADHYNQDLAETHATRVVNKDRSTVGKIAGVGAGVASNFLLPTGILGNAAVAGVDAATQGPGDIDLKEGAKGASLATAIDLLLRGGGKILKKLPSGITGVSDELADYYKANHKAVDAARPLQDVSNDLGDAAKTFRREMSNQSTEGFNALAKSGMSATASQLDAPIAAQVDRLGANAVTGQAKAVVGELSSLRESIAAEAAANNGVLGATGLDKVKSFVRQIDDLIDYEAVNNNRASSRDKALLSIRREYDGLLKNDKGYEEIMQGLSSKASALDDVSAGLKNPKSTDNFLKRIASNKDPRSAEALSNLDSHMGTDFSKEVKDAGVKDVFNRENSRGTRNSFVSGAVGMLAGSAIGMPPWISGAIGATAGPVVDKHGRQIYARILKAQAENPELMAKFSKVLDSAAQSGPASLIATHQLLMKKPEYKQTMGE